MPAVWLPPPAILRALRPSLLLAFVVSLPVESIASREGGSSGHDWTFWAASTALFQVERNGPDDVLAVSSDGTPDAPGFLRPRLDHDDAQLYLLGGGQVLLSSWATIAITVDTGLVEFEGGEWLANGHPLGEEIERTGLLRQAWLDLAPSEGPLQVGLGRREARVGGGLVFDEYATGIELTIEAGLDGVLGGVLGGVIDAEPLRVELGLWAPGRQLVPDPDTSRLLVASARWQPVLMSEIYVFGATADDRGDNADMLIDSAADLALRPLGSRAAVVRDIWLHNCSAFDAELSLWYAGLGADLVLDGHTLNVVGMLGGGQVRWLLAPRLLRNTECQALNERMSPRWGAHGEVEIDAYALDLSWRARAHGWLYPGLFLTWLSGEKRDGEGNPFADGTFEGFVALAPHVRRPALFFGSGLGAGLYGRTAAVAGVSGHGVIAPGASLLVAIGERLELTALAALLLADEPRAGRSERSYGQEIDLTMCYEATDTVRVRAEIAALKLGLFYPETAVWWRGTVGLEIESLPLE